MPTSRTRPAAAAKKVAATSAKKQLSTAKSWKKNKPIELELPSGEVCLVKRPGMDALLAKGLFGDAIMPMIQKSISDARGGKRPDTSDLDPDQLMSDPKKMADMFDAFDRVTAECVVEPTVQYHKDSEGNAIPESDRDEDIIYTDDVDMNDKMFLFQYVVGGSSDLATFREQFS